MVNTLYIHPCLHVLNFLSFEEKPVSEQHILNLERAFKELLNGGLELVTPNSSYGQSKKGHKATQFHQCFRFKIDPLQNMDQSTSLERLMELYIGNDNYLTGKIQTKGKSY